jgi:hypothetical protein
MEKSRHPLVIFFAISFDVLAILGIIADDNNWQVYIPAIASLAAVISLLYFDSKKDWLEIIHNLPSRNIKKGDNLE